LQALRHAAGRIVKAGLLRRSDRCFAGPGDPGTPQLASDTHEQAMCEIAIEPRIQDLLRRRLDVVSHAVELEEAGLRVEYRVARAVIVGAWLTDGAVTNDVLVAGLEDEIDRRKFFHRIPR